MFEFLKKGISTSIAIGIIFVLAVFVGGVTYWQYQEMQKEELGGIEISVPEKEEAPVAEEKIEEEEKKEEIIQEEELGPEKISNTTKAGTLVRDEEWSGEIYVDGWLIVPKGITLTIMPGTLVEFRYTHDYKNPYKGHLRVDGGILRVLGTAKKQVWFTSVAEKPINGDWEGIHILNSKNENIIDHAIIEYSTIGVLFFDSSGTVSNSIIRWINNEGIYMERSNPRIENNTIYSVNYNGIAMEQFNDNVIIKGNKIFNILHNTGIHGEATNVTIENNIIRNNKYGITIDDFSHAIIKNNLIENNSWGVECRFRTRCELAGNEIRNNSERGIGSYESEIFLQNNDIDNKINLSISLMEQVEIKENWWGSVDRTIIDKKIKSNEEISYGISEKEQVEISEPVFDYIDIKKTELGYSPGDPEDEYPYFFSLEDETRRIVKRIYPVQGGFGWSLAWADGYLWLFEFGGSEILIKLNPETGEIVKRFENTGIAQPHGIAFDGKSLWINDFSSLKVFEVNPESGKILSSFKIPAMESGASGIAWDGQYLYLVNWVKQEQIYKVDRKGNLFEVMKLKGIGGQSITFDGKYFWVAQCGHEICKYDKQGNLVGKIYQAVEGTWAIAYDGEYLWTLQRTNENWADEKVYQIEVLDDSLIK